MSNIYARITTLKSSSGGVTGRIDYISDPERQEEIIDFYSTADLDIWQQLSMERKIDNKSSGQFESCIEAREITLALPHMYFEQQDEKEIAKQLADDFKKNYNVPCAVAIHGKGNRKNIHAHIVFSESELLAEPEIKIAPRNMFYDENGKHCRTKKEVLGEDGNVREGCHIVKKGEIYKTKYFSGKRDDLRAIKFTHIFKQHYAELLNLEVYNKDQNCIKQIKYGKGNPRESEIKEFNQSAQRFNARIENFEPEIAKAVTERAREDIKNKTFSAAMRTINGFLVDLSNFSHKLKEKLENLSKNVENGNLGAVGVFETETIDKEIMRLEEKIEYYKECCEPWVNKVYRENRQIEKLEKSLESNLNVLDIIKQARALEPVKKESEKKISFLQTRFEKKHIAELNEYEKLCKQLPLPIESYKLEQLQAEVARQTEALEESKSYLIYLETHGRPKEADLWVDTKDKINSLKEKLVEQQSIKPEVQPKFVQPSFSEFKEKESVKNKLKSYKGQRKMGSDSREKKLDFER